jgi:hypothetical protein
MRADSEEQPSLYVETWHCVRGQANETIKVLSINRDVAIVMAFLA